LVALEFELRTWHLLERPSYYLSHSVSHSLLFCGAGYQTYNFVHAKQVFSHWATSPAYHYSFLCMDSSFYLLSNSFCLKINFNDLLAINPHILFWGKSFSSFWNIFFSWHRIFSYEY
jgi:hypothetical protein